MNILLYVPAYASILLHQCGGGVWFWSHIIVGLVGFQAVVGLPFILPPSLSTQYFANAFQFHRTFSYEWTVNWKFIPELFFQSKQFSLTLLALHVSLVALFLFKYRKMPIPVILSKVFLLSSEKTVLFSGRRYLRPSTSGAYSLTPDQIVHLMFGSHFIGICFCRTLHYQFYSWYFFSLPYLLYCLETRLRSFLPRKLVFVFLVLLWALLELCWNIFPANAFSSSLLFGLHLLLLFSIFAIN